MAKPIILADEPEPVIRSVIRCVHKGGDGPDSWANNPIATYGTNTDRQLAYVFDDPDEAERQAAEARVKWPHHIFTVEPAS